MSLIAITHVPSREMELGQRTYLGRSAIDPDLATLQHQAYARMLEQLGAEVVILNSQQHLADCAFIEDTAIVLDEIAVLASMGTQARRAELAGIAPALEKYRVVQRIPLPAHIEGGDVLTLGKKLLVGLSSRTNREGIEALANFARPHGYQVTAIPVLGCLHLKTACSALPDGTLLINPAWIDVTALGELPWRSVPAPEPWGANTLPIADTICLAANHEETADLIRSLGYQVYLIDISEFAKAEGGVTCLSLVFSR